MFRVVARVITSIFPFKKNPRRIRTVVKKWTDRIWTLIGTVVWGTVFWGDNSVGESRVRPRIMNDVGNDLVDEFGGNNDAEYSPTTVTEGPGEPGQNVFPMGIESLGTDEPQREPEKVATTNETAGGLGQESDVPPGNQEGMSEHLSPESKVGNMYGPVRQHRPLTTAMRQDLNLLDSGRPSSYKPPSISHEAMMVQKKCGRKEVFENELFVG